MSTGWQPYRDGTSGHQGDTSQRAEPKRRKLIDRGLDALIATGSDGLTYEDLGRILNRGHGSASSVLSNLHRTGAAVRLVETRNGCGVYVIPGNVQGRATVAYRSQRKGPDREQVTRAAENWNTSYHTQYLLVSQPALDRLIDILMEELT